MHRLQTHKCSFTLLIHSSGLAHSGSKSVYEACWQIVIESYSDTRAVIIHVNLGSMHSFWLRIQITKKSLMNQFVSGTKMSIEWFWNEHQFTKKIGIAIDTLACSKNTLKYARSLHAIRQTNSHRFGWFPIQMDSALTWYCKRVFAKF